MYDRQALIALIRECGLEFGDWRAELFAENVLNEQAILSCCRLNGEFVTNRPRTVGLRVSYRG